jgi:hypothetical protein
MKVSGNQSDMMHHNGMTRDVIGGVWISVLKKGVEKQ